MPSLPTQNRPLSFWTFVGLLLLLCAVPGVLYVSFNKTLGSYSSGDIPSPHRSQTGQQPSQASNATVSANLRFTRMPVKMGETSWTLTLKNRETGQPITVLPTVKVLMAMDGHPMTAHTTLEKTRVAGEFSGQSDLTMGGDWTLEVAVPGQTTAPLGLKFWVLEAL